MNTELKNTVQVTDEEAQYDECAKRILGQKTILAHILVKTVDEFYGMKPEDVVAYIEGEPLIGTVPVDPGMTNGIGQEGERIIGFNTENVEVNEGLIRFDVIFYVRTRDRLTRIIINVEAQKSQPNEYDILNRGIFYMSRLVSSQKERDFVNSDFNDLRRVYSIWICFNMPENGINHIHLTNDCLLGSCQWKGSLDILNVIMIGIGQELPPKDEEYELHRLIGTLFSKKLTVTEKMNILEDEYHLPMEEKLREEVSIMCNLSQGIKEDGIAIGQEIGFENGRKTAQVSLIRKKYNKKMDAETIADFLEEKLSLITAVIDEIKKNPTATDEEIVKRVW